MIEIDSKEKFKNIKVTIMGLGLNGGGVASARFFAECGAYVTVTDMKTMDQLTDSVQALKYFKNIKYVLGKHDIQDFKNADIVIKNPGVKRAGNKFLDVANQIETDISIFLKLSSSPILAVTGSKGKSSTVSALYYGLKKAGYNAFLGGNITVSPLTFLGQTNKLTPVVLELSSWQLSDLKNTSLKPKIIIMTPIMPDHQNWYGNMDDYVADKKIIYKNQTNTDFIICNHDDKWGDVFSTESLAKSFWYSTDNNFMYSKKSGVYFNSNKDGVFKNNSSEIVLLPHDAKIVGSALRQNTLNAALAMYLFGVPKNKIASIMREYPGLEHRLELFYETKILRFFNDTTATVPEAVVAALKSFDAPPILIAGGTDKNLDFTSLAENSKLADKIFLLEGSGTDILIEKFNRNNVAFFGPYKNLTLLLESLKLYLNHNNSIINIVFSPGATSFGMFKNEFDRGNTFKRLVCELF